MRPPALAAVVVAALALAIARSRRRGLAPLGRGALRILAPLCLGIAAAPASPPLPPHLPAGPLAIEAVVIGPPRPRPGRGTEEETIQVRLGSLAIAGRTLPGELDASIRGDPPLGRGDRIRAIARATVPGRIRIAHPEHLRVVERSPAGTLDRGRRELRRRFRSTLPRRAAAWSSALLLGDRALLDEETTRVFRATGQTHLLAISGMHVALLIAIARGIERRLPGPGRRRAGPLAAAAILAYAGLAGGDPPVLRSALFATIVLLAPRSGGRPRLPELLVLTLLILGAATAAGGEWSFWLTFGAVAGIAAVSARDRAEAPGGGGLVRRGRALRIAFGAWLGAQVVLVWITPEVVLLGPLITIVLAPWLAAMLAGSILALLPGAAELLGTPLDLLARLGERIAGVADRLPGTPWTIPPIPPLAASAVFAASLATLAGRRRAAALLLAAALALVLAAPRSPRPALLAPDLARGQGAFVLGESATLLLDAGSIDHAEGGARTLRDHLWRAGGARIDLVVLSHPHGDHVLALPGLLARLPVGAVAVGPRFGESDLGAAIESRVRRAGVPLLRLCAGARLRVGAFEVEALHPSAEIPSGMVPSTNDDSLVVRVRGEGIDLLAPGDLQGPGLASIAPPDVAWLLLPHHGRDAPGTEAWLRAADPEVAVSIGGETPSAELRAVLAAIGARWREPAPGAPVVVTIDDRARR